MSNSISVLIVFCLPGFHGLRICKSGILAVKIRFKYRGFFLQNKAKGSSAQTKSDKLDDN